jgi:heavy metal-binding protein
MKGRKMNIGAVVRGIACSIPSLLETSPAPIVISNLLKQGWGCPQHSHGVREHGGSCPECLRELVPMVEFALDEAEMGHA